MGVGNILVVQSKHSLLFSLSMSFLTNTVLIPKGNGHITSACTSVQVLVCLTTIMVSDWQQILSTCIRESEDSPQLLKFLRALALGIELAYLHVRLCWQTIVEEFQSFIKCSPKDQTKVMNQAMYSGFILVPNCGSRLVP